MDINKLLSGNGTVTFDDIDNFMEEKEHSITQPLPPKRQGARGPDSWYSGAERTSKVPVGTFKKCCWVCRTEGVSLSLLPQSDASHRFRINPTQVDHYKSMETKETLWANKTPKEWKLENGEELAWTCFDCAH